MISTIDRQFIVQDITNIVPILAPELHIQKFSDSAYLLHQKKYGHYVKVSKAVYQLLELIDGKKSFQLISDEYNAKYKQAITAELPYTLFFKKLVKYGLLTNTSDLAKYSEKPNYLKLSFTIVGANTLDGITPFFAFLFTPRLIKLFFIASSAICMGTLWLNFEEIKQFFYMFVPTTEAVVFFFGIMFLSVTFHEIGHVSAAKFYGARHGGIGGGFYLFTPVYYADVTDIWRLPVKQRIMVNVAGVYFELLFCSFLCVLSLLISNSYLGVMAFIVFLHSLYNLLPFIRNDGYWVLSDALGTPNLSKKSSSHLLEWFKSICQGNTYTYSRKMVFLLFYGFVNNFLIVFYIISVLFYDVDSVLYFPKNLYHYVHELYTTDAINFTLSDLKQFLVPMVFYYLVFRFVKRVILKILVNKGLKERA